MQPFGPDITREERAMRRDFGILEGLEAEEPTCYCETKQGREVLRVYEEAFCKAFSVQTFLIVTKFIQLIES